MKKNYVTPEMEMLEVQIEKGFATSAGPQPGENPDTGEGGVVPFP